MLLPEDKSQKNVSQEEADISENLGIKELKHKLNVSEESKKELSVKVKLAEESKKKLMIDHKDAIKEVGRMKEQVEKLKIELNSVSEYRTLIRNKSSPISASLPPAPSSLPPCTTAPQPASLPSHKCVQQTTSPLAVQVGARPASPHPAPWTTVPPSNRKSPK